MKILRTDLIGSHCGNENSMSFEVSFELPKLLGPAFFPITWE